MPFAEIDKEILLGLRSKPMSIYEISRRTGRAWRTVRDHLRRLKELGKVESFDNGVGRLWRLKQAVYVVSDNREIVSLELLKIAHNLVDARELMYYDKVSYKIRLPLIEECGVILPLHFFETLRSLLTNIMGNEKAEEILFNIGWEHGFYVIDKLSSMLDSERESLSTKLFNFGMTNEEVQKLFKSVFESQGFFKVISIGREGKSIVFKLQYCFESMAYSDAYACSFMKGFLVGVLEAYFHEKSTGCEELVCSSNGDDYCIFSVKFDNLLS